MTRTIHNPALRAAITFLVTARESDGAITELEAMVMPGGKNPPHYHKTYDETFTVIEGVLRLDLSGGARKDLVAGQSYVVIAGNVHSFRNETNGPTRIRTLIVPGNEGFENSLRILAGLASDGFYNIRLKMPRSLQQLSVCGSMSDTWLAGPLCLLNWPLRLLARFARWRGVENELLLRYCQ
jgi:quercetin dioxygenase-like cupin family protein